MKPEFNKKYTTIAVYAFLVIAAALCFWAVLNHIGVAWGAVGKIAKVIVPFVNGFIIAYLINPVVKVCEKWFSRVKKSNPKSRLRRVLSIISAYVMVLGAITGFCILIVPQIGKSIAQFALQVQEWAPKAYAAVEGFIKNTEYEAIVAENIQKLVKGATSLALTYSGDSIAAVFSGVTSFARGVINIILGFIISLYMLYDKEKFIRQGKMLVKAFTKPGHAQKIIDVAGDAHQIFSGFIGAKIIDSIIVGVICTIGMWILRLPFAELIGFIIGISNLIPYFGSWIGGIIATLMIMVVSPLQAIWFVVLVLVLQQVDNSIISPKILGDSTGISPFWTMFAIIVGGGFFGIAGMLIGVPVFALIYSLFSAYVKRKAN
ncbi:MAG: AI-2E family transporter [Clostridia bacterium]|nr:AI-2E family transporter [Clostridia bacterium]